MLKQIKQVVDTSLDLTLGALEAFRFANRFINDIRFIVPRLIIHDLERQLEEKEQQKTVEVAGQEYTVIMEEKQIH